MLIEFAVMPTATKVNFDKAIVDYTKVLELVPEELVPDYVLVYYNRALAWLHQQEWEKAEEDLTAATDNGINVAAMFHYEFQSSEAFEKVTGVKLPANIAALLMPQGKKQHPQSIKESPSQPSLEIQNKTQHTAIFQKRVQSRIDPSLFGEQTV